MNFMKLYRTRVPNASRTLNAKIEIAPLLTKIRQDSVKKSIASLLHYKKLNFWDFGVRATSQLEIGSPVEIICSYTCYSGVVISKISDPMGELGDLFGWTRQFKAPWRNICALDVNSTSLLSKQMIEERVRLSNESAPNFYVTAESKRKSQALKEGNILELTLTTFERDPAARKACLSHYGTSCQICHFDFGAVYGNLGNGFIHVHHITPLAQIRQSHTVDPITDLIPVCPNCHAMLHINQEQPLKIEQLKAIMAQKIQNTQA